MEWLQTLLDSSTAPALTAFLLGLLTAVSPCPLATNIAAVGFIGKDIENRRRIFLNGLLYTLGRVIAYTVLGIVLIMILREGASLFGIQKFIGKYGESILGPALVIIGVFMLFRNADTDVRHRNPRLSAACTFRRSHCVARPGGRLDIGIQRTAHRQFLRQDADRTKMAERDCRLSFCGHRNILLHNNVFINKKEAQIN